MIKKFTQVVMVECYRRIKFQAGGEEERREARGMWMEKGVIGEGQ